ncbi:MAG: hypothetical protein U5J96_19820 [Ignavibacteriaceae bacterium]|nr:hypothetical protein [Ignavibacteriaceae bacterium]
MKYFSSRPTSVYVLLILITLQGVSGLFGGVLLIIDPSGELLNLPINLLKKTPFQNYLIPGLILFNILGIIPLIILNGLWKNKYWAWYGSLIVGIALIIWIFVEVLMIGYQSEPPLQFIYGLVGLLILIFTLLPSVKYFYKI